MSIINGRSMVWADDYTPTCPCGCQQPPRTRSTWLSHDARMMASPDCERRFGLGLLLCSCGREFPKDSGGRVVKELVCRPCYDAATKGTAA